MRSGVPVGSCQLNRSGCIRHKWTAVGIRRSQGKRCVVQQSQGNSRQLQVVFVTTEVAPWSKVGGLGDVMAALPAALAARGHRVMTVSPMYSDYCDVRDTGVQVPVRLPADVRQQQDRHQQFEGTQPLPAGVDQLIIQQRQQREQPLQQQSTALPHAVQHRQQQQVEQQQQGPNMCPHLQQQQQQRTGQKQPQHDATNTYTAAVLAAADVHASGQQAQPADVAQAEAVFRRTADPNTTTTTTGNSGSGGDSASSHGVSSGHYARYYMCCSAGVHRVFVDHPLYQGGASRGSGKPWPTAIISSYTHPAAAVADRAAPDLAAAASVLCQAALAAPLLLWGVSRGLEGSMPGQEQQLSQLQQIRQWQRQQKQHLQRQQLEMQLLMQLLGLDNTIAKAAAGAGDADGGSAVTAVLAAAAEQQQAQLAQHLQYPQQIVAGLASPVLLGTGGSEVDSRWQVSDLLLPQQQQTRIGSPAAAGVDAPVLFIANDWPCGVLPLWLEAYRQQAQHWQQGNPHMEWLKQEQQELFNQVTQRNPQQQQRQQQDARSGHGAGADNVHSLVQAAVEAFSSSDSSSDSCDECDGSSSASGSRPVDICDVSGDYSAVYVNGTHLKNPSAPQQQLLQDLQEGWQLQQDSSGQPQQPQVPPAGLTPASLSMDTDSSYDSSSSWSAAADAWLQEVGYDPGSVYDAELSALVSAAVQAGRVPQQHLPELTALQSQLQQALKQEQALGEAISKLRRAAIRLQPSQQQQPAADAYSSRPSTETAAATASGTTSSPKPKPVPIAAAAAAPLSAVPVLSHEQEVSLLQQMLGRQLADSKVVFAIHNFGYQGTFGGGRGNFDRLGLPQHMVSAFMTPVAQAAATAAQAAAAAASAVGSQLAALVEAMHQWVPGSRHSSSHSRGSVSDAGLLSSVQQALLQAKAEGLPSAEAAGEQEQHLLSANEPLQSSSVRQAAAGETAHEQQQPDGCGAVVGGSELNWLRAGVSASDVAITVSSGYARQMLEGSWEATGVQPDSNNSSSCSASMAALLASKKLRGILNGLDTQCWDPAADSLLPSAVRYSSDTAAAGKAAAKQLLQRRLGLTVDQTAPLFAFVGRLTPQKGVDVILAATPQLMRASAAHEAASHDLQEQQQLDGDTNRAVTWSTANSSYSSGTAAAQHLKQDTIQESAAVGSVCGSVCPQLVLLGTGERWMEEVLGQLAGRYRGRAVGVTDYNEPLAHLFMAAADVLLVPSRFEPCGLVALAGLRYGAVPIATATGGLADIVSPDVGYLMVNPGPEGDAAGFRRGVQGLVAAMQQVVQEYGSDEFAAKRAAAMAVDVSWEAPCKAWEQVLLQLVEQDAAAPAGAASSGD